MLYTKCTKYYTKILHCIRPPNSSLSSFPLFTLEKSEARSSIKKVAGFQAIKKDALIHIDSAKIFLEPKAKCNKVLANNYHCVS